MGKRSAHVPTFRNLRELRMERARLRQALPWEERLIFERLQGVGRSAVDMVRRELLVGVLRRTLSFFRCRRR